MDRWDWVGASAGVVLILYTFMKDITVELMQGGVEAVVTFEPIAFDWPIFLVGYALMTYVVLRILFLHRRIQSTS